MKNRSKGFHFFMGLLVVLMLGTSAVLFMQQTPSTSPDISETQAEIPRRPDNFISSYIDHDPITITSNDDFTTRGFPGSGTEEDPYVIQGYSITTGPCISITNTNASFSIRNCLLTGGRSAMGVKLHGVDNGEIRNNNISGNTNGVYLSFSYGNTIASNIISGNIIRGVSLSSSYGNIVENNIISGSHYGVFISSSANTTLSSNIFVNNGIGISGYTVEHWLQNIATDNLVNEKPIGYFCNLASGTIDGTLYGQVILVNCTGVTVEDGVFSDASVGIALGHSSNCSLVNNIISGNRVGVDLSSSSGNTVVNNSISGSNHGVSISFSSGNTLVNNSISGTSYRGMSLTSSAENNTIYLNVFVDTRYETAHDDGVDNHWNSTGIGNYWSDYNGTGVYQIPGDAGSIDYHPFTYQPEPTSTTATTTSTTNPNEELSGLSIVLLGVFGLEVVVAVIILTRHLSGSTTGSSSDYYGNYRMKQV